MTTRLGIAASLMNDPDLLIWDEPTAGLDPEGHKYTLDLIQELGETKTILVSSHNLADIKRLCSHIAIVSEGRLIFSGTMRDMRSLTRSSAIELELDGDPDRLRAALTASAITLHWELDRQSLKVHFSPDESTALGLSQVLQCVVAAEARLLAVNSLHDEVVDAFIHLLEEERSHGFSRILRMESENHGVLGAAGS
jgi:ABC-2 type transport system ATP-binding protein